MVALGDVVQVKGGGTPSKANASFWNGNIPWVSPKDMKYWHIEDAEDKITSDAISGSATNLVPKNSILIVNRSGILKHTLPVGITQRPVAINQDIKALICGPRSHPEYIAHIVKAAEPIVLKWVRATTADNFPIENLRSLDIPLPPLDEQRRIAAILDKADALRRKRKRALDLLDSLSQSIFLNMFGNETNTGEVAEICSRVTDGTHQAPNWADHGIPFLFVSNVRKQSISYETNKFVSTDEYHRLTKNVPIEQGDVLYTAVGSYGNAAVVRNNKKFVFQRHIAHLKPRTERVLPSYLSYALESPIVKEQADKMARGVAQKTVTLDSLKKFVIPLPPISKQLQFDEIVRSVTARLVKVGAAAIGLDSLFSSLQHRAFAGQL